VRQAERPAADDQYWVVRNVVFTIGASFGLLKKNEYEESIACIKTNVNTFYRACCAIKIALFFAIFTSFHFGPKLLYSTA